MVRRAYCGPLHVPKALLAANRDVFNTAILFATASRNVLDAEVFLGLLLDNPMNEIGQRLQPGRGRRGHVPPGHGLRGSISGRSLGFHSSSVDPYDGVQEGLGVKRRGRAGESGLGHDARYRVCKDVSVKMGVGAQVGRLTDANFASLYASLALFVLVQPDCESILKTKERL
jgi:hypothetical protein